MKNIGIALVLVIVLFSLDTYGQKEYPTGLTRIDKSATRLKKRISEIKSISFSKGMRLESGTSLPDHVDNSVNKYFPPILYQVGASCAQASGIGYILTYELNRLLNKEGSVEANNMSYMQIWNYLNEGKGWGSHTIDGWDLAKENGVVPYVRFNTDDDKLWVTGYDDYYLGASNQVEEIVKFDIDDDPDALVKMKNFLCNHGDGSQTGGLIQFSAFAHNLNSWDAYEGPSASGYKVLVKGFSYKGMHAMTIAGYDDNIEWDYSGDGNISDDERGAFICVNSWGKQWGDNGRFYVPYKVFTELVEGEGGTGNDGKECYAIVARHRDPLLMFKVRMIHSSRNDIKLVIGVSRDPNGDKPQKTKELKMMKNQGGDFQLRGMLGEENEMFEFGIDATDFAEFIGNNEGASFFIRVMDEEQGTECGKGEILSASIIDYRKDRNNPEEHEAIIENPGLESGKKTLVRIGTAIPAVGEGLNTLIYISIKTYTKEIKLNFISKEDAYAQVDILNTAGEVIENKLSKNIEKGSQDETFSFSSLSPGIYAIRVVVDNQFVYKKLIIK